MDDTHTSTGQEDERAIEDGDFSPTILSNILAAPARLLVVVVSSGSSFLRPFAPQLIPVLICLFLVPLAILLSLTAGFIVWKNVAVGWESPLHLQFG